ncbi:MAG: exodeoxyribonuclease V subunit gamma [Firmicutes bacterium]|nr:exodeoxyribonuclease V subunit gamma [Bacillota bacterium]
MLHIYYGREHIDKDKFLFSRVKESLAKIRSGISAVERIYVIVPDQFTLQAEQNALDYMDEPGLLEVDVLSMSRLGHRILSETAGATRTHIDKYGRHMLISGILKEKQAELMTFGGTVSSVSFVEMVNDLITEMKQHNVEPQDIPNILESVEQGSLLYRKLADIYHVFEEYQERIIGKYVDTEDYTRLVTEQIPHSPLVRSGEFWIYGFDSFTPKSMALLGQLMACAMDVNLVMIGDPGVCGPEKEPGDGDLFGLSKMVMDQLRLMAMDQGTIWEQKAIGEEYRRPERHSQLEHLERNLYAWPHQIYAAETGFVENFSDGNDPEDAVAFCRAANIYNEAESAAAEILRLVRDRGYRYEDITVITNDMEGRGSVISRVFGKYGIPVFLDKKRTVLHNPAVEYLMGLLDTLSGRIRYEELFQMVKTGLSDLSRDEGERLENYILSYRSAASNLRRPFRYGVSRYGEDGLKELEDMRKRLVDPVVKLSSAMKKEKTGLGKTRLLYEYLTGTAKIPEKLMELCDVLEEAGEQELLSETAQIWKIISGLLDQIVELCGEEELSTADYAAMLNAGCSAVEIGLLPPSYDQVIVGTMQRTRTGNVKALLVLGANDGLLPGSGASEDLLSEQEKAMLLSKDLQICKDDSWRLLEEKIAIYKNLSKPSERLWISYTVADGDGGAAKASLIYEKLQGIFPQIPEVSDILNREQVLDRVQSADNALEHLTGAVREWMTGEETELDPVWKGTLNWFLNNSPAYLEPLQEGVAFDNRIDRLEQGLVDRIYKKEGYEQLVLSPSRLERFGKCPFSHFLQYGLRPEERRVFELAGRETGDVYHECLMMLSRQLTSPDIAVTDPESEWMKISREQCQIRVSELMEQIADRYGEAVLRSGGREEYRLERMKRICTDAAWILIQHVRQGQISDMYLEAGFGRGNHQLFPPIEISESVRIEGKIDRVDVLPGADGTPYVKVIDYKSGTEIFRPEEAKGGYRLQLMLYLQGAVNGVKNAEPAGVFYFMIGEPSVNADGYDAEELTEKVTDTVEKSFKMNGLMVDEPQVIRSVAGDFEKTSSVLALSRKKDGTLSKTSESSVLSAEDFREFREEVSRTIRTLCQELVGGNISAEPRKTKTTDACQYCDFKSVCYFDTAFSGCRYKK